jgi:hypothetical protein
MNMLEVIVAGAAEAVRRERPSAPLACPFCGSDPPLASQIANRFIVGCDSDDCHANPQVSGQSVSEAWGKWNSRR